MNVSSVDVEPECVNMDSSSFMRSHELIARHVLHLEKGVYHGQFVRYTELLIHIDIGGELGGFVEFVEQQWLTELRRLQSKKLSDGPVAVSSDPGAEGGELRGRDIGGVGVDVIQHVHGLAVAVAADDDVFDIVEDTGELKHRGLCGHAVNRHQGARKRIL